MQNKSEKYSRAYRRCPKVSVGELREAMGAPLNAHRATASLARAAPTRGRCARPASSRCTTRPQTRVRTPLVASGSRWLDEQHPLGRLLGPAAAVAAVGLRDSTTDQRWLGRYGCGECKNGYALLRPRSMV